MEEPVIYSSTGRWIDPADGKTEYAYRVSWYITDEMARPVGFMLQGSTVHDIPPEISATLMRRVPVASLIESSRDDVAHLMRFQERPTAESRVADKPRRPGRPADHGEDHYQRVADHYATAKAQGGAVAHKAAQYVRTQLEKEGVRVISDQQVRGWIQQARKRGLIEPANQKRKGVK